jgi:hypothetical protein
LYENFKQRDHLEDKDIKMDLQAIGTGLIWLRTSNEPLGNISFRKILTTYKLVAFQEGLHSAEFVS